MPLKFGAVAYVNPTCCVSWSISILRILQVRTLYPYPSPRIAYNYPIKQGQGPLSKPCRDVATHSRGDGSDVGKRGLLWLFPTSFLDTTPPSMPLLYLCLKSFQRMSLYHCQAYLYTRIQ